MKYNNDNDDGIQATDEMTREEEKKHNMTRQIDRHTCRCLSH